MPEAVVAVTPGSGANVEGFNGSDGNFIQKVMLTNRGYCEAFASTFRIPGIAGTAGQKLFALHNSTSSTVEVDVKSLRVSKVETVVMLVTVLPPVIRAWKFTAVPTNGTAATKTVRNSAATASNAQVTAWQGAQSDGTASGTALTITLPTNTHIAGLFAPRLITAAGEQKPDEYELIPKGTSVVLRPLEGICVFLDYTLTTQNAATDMWLVSANWEEYVV